MQEPPCFVNSMHERTIIDLFDGIDRIRVLAEETLEVAVRRHGGKNLDAPDKTTSKTGTTRT